MQGMAVFSEKIETEEAGFFRKMKKSWRGSNESCQDAYEEVIITIGRKESAKCHEKIQIQERISAQPSQRM